MPLIISAHDLEQASLYKLWQKLVAEGLAKVIFFNVRFDFDGFVAWALNGQVDFYVVMDGQKILGGFWLSQPDGLCARIHFYIFKAAKPRAKELGFFVLEQLSKSYISLLGLIPARYFGARKYAESLGGELLGQVPCACRFVHNDSYSDGCLYLFNL